MALTEAEIKAKAEQALVDAGVDPGDAGYLAELYSRSPKGRELTKPDNQRDPVLASNCVGVGIVPL